ncbi:hypothetical protein [Lichenibacterium dinghuense]|uniref:hypothetical protein n=1 Tax=Lichenibacterium dinghuense TaxID=2895977 RepID=UPI001F164504|nr:hypothetical protein [Lichenibacterium sp. 6Y81]
MAQPDQKQFNYSPAVTATGNGLFGLGTNLTWDAYQREVYNQANAALQKQARALMASGRITDAEARALSEQRNLILAAARDRLSPFGRLYSEILKPSGKLPSYDGLLTAKGSIEAVIESVGRTRAVVNRLSVVMKNVGRAGVALQVVVSVVLIAEAKPEDRGRVTAGQAGALGGSAVAGWGGAWAGYASAALLASPSLTIPIVGEVTEGGACLVGGLLGGFGFGLLGGWGGQKAGEEVYDLVTRIRWIRP